tara:strand:+ start:707 stop:931 length:225 start_codon:yes stop_codon:yes gene_type:complete
MKCTACKDKIKIWQYDTMDAIEEVSPVTFRLGNYHLECYKLLIEEAEQIPSKENDKYANRLDEYYTRGLSVIIV